MKQLNRQVLSEVQSMEREFGSIDEAPNDCEQLTMTHHLLNGHNDGRPKEKARPLNDKEVSIVHEYFSTQETLSQVAHKYHHAPNTIREYVQKYQREVSPHPSVQEKSEDEE